MKNENRKNKLLIIGASGHGKVVADIAIKMNQWQQIVFLDDDETINDCMGLEVVGKTIDAAWFTEDHDIVVAIGNNNTREKIQIQLEQVGASIATLIHPQAIIGENVEIEAGTVIMAGTVINCCSKVGKGCIINTGATIDHDNVIGAFVHISPGAHLAGTVEIGDKSWIGIGAVISNNLNVTSEVCIGAGSVVIGNITEAGTYVGLPAKVIKDLKN
jgi:sugar O-acyltransferase (sialic acid O-acetyltransferase NeuD family)